MAQLEQYRIFASVAKNKSFGKAAAELYITQPAVSQSVKQLENELGAQLFIRTPRGAALTEAGEALYGYTEQALSILRGAEERLKELKELDVGTLAIGASDTLCEHYLLPYLRDFHARYPKINLRITNRTSKETVALLASGGVDIGFVNTPCETGSSVTVRPLKPLHSCFVFSPARFPELCGKETTFAELAEYPLLMLERGSAMRRHTDDFFRSEGIRLYPQTELGSHDLLLSFAEIGLGVAIVVREYTEKQFASGTLREVKTPKGIPLHEVSLITRDRVPLSFAARVFVGMIE